jgi:hypothetical protein
VAIAGLHAAFKTISKCSQSLLLPHLSCCRVQPAKRLLVLRLLLLLRLLVLLLLLRLVMGVVAAAKTFA